MIRMTRRRVPVRATSHPPATWPLQDRLNRDGPREPTVIHGPLGPKYHPLEKANAIVCRLEK